MKAILLFFLFAAFTVPAFAMTGQVVITEGGTEQLRENVGNNLTNVINALASNDLSPFENALTDDGFRSLNGLLQSVKMENAMRTKTTRLIALPSGGWEVRDIKVKVDLGETAENEVPVAKNPFQYLVFELTPDGLIDDVRSAIEPTHYESLFGKGNKLADFTRRQQILQTIEIFRTAYCRKDIDYLRKIYSDDALIIVGKVIEKDESIPDFLEKNSVLSRDKIQFIKKSKVEYLGDLERAFKRNAFVKVVFDSVSIERHETDSDLYGVTLKQNWYSSTYSDTGWVFLLWDFKYEERPMIYVRSWQPEKFDDNSVPNVHEFVIARPQR